MTILIADDHPIFSSGLQTLLKKKFPKAAIIEANTGELALKLAEEHNPDFCILDIDMPAPNGIEVCKQLIINKITSNIIFLTMHREKELVRKAMLAGGSGYLLKENATEELIDAIQSIKEGKKFIGPALASFYDQLEDDKKKKQELDNLINSLSRSEIKVLKLVAGNNSSKEIAEMLFLSEKTIENHRSKICQKLNLPPRNNSLLLWISENRNYLNSLSEF